MANMTRTYSDVEVIEMVQRAVAAQKGVALVRAGERDSFVVRMADGTEREFVMFDVGGFERRLTAGMHAHTAATYEALHQDLLRRAGEAWAADRTDEAELLKKAAKDLEKRGREARRKQRNAEAG